MPEKQCRDICEIISVVCGKGRGCGRRSELLSSLEAAAPVLTLAPTRVFLMPSDEPRLTGVLGSPSSRFLRVSGGCSLLYASSRLQGIHVIGIGGLLLYRVIHVIVNGISICRI